VIEINGVLRNHAGNSSV